MESGISHKKISFRSMLLAILAVLMLASLIIPTDHTYAETDAEKVEGMIDLTLYGRASELSRAFGNGIAPGSDTDDINLVRGTGEGDDRSVATPGNIGGVLGYSDTANDDEGVKGWLTSSFTTASSTLSYEQLEGLVSKNYDNYKAINQNLTGYARYGEALTSMGLVKTIRVDGSGSMGRFVATGTLMVVYMLANVSPFLFNIALTMLDLLNPFKLFMGVINGTGDADAGILSDVANYVGGIYEQIQNLALYVLLPMLLALTIMSILLFTQGSALKKMARYGLRVFMIFAGIPLIGATYTGIVEDLNESASAGSEFADYLIYSSYVDFEKWVNDSRLAPPDGARIRSMGHGTDVANESQSVVNRKTILKINDREKEFSDYISPDIGKIVGDGSDNEIIKDGTVKSKSSFTRTFKLLGRHMFASTYSVSDYEGTVVKDLQKLRNDGDETEFNILKMYSFTDTEGRSFGERANFKNKELQLKKAINWSKAEGLLAKGASKDDFNIDPDYIKRTDNIYSSGSLTISDEGYYGMGDDNLKGYGLSHLSMYNFLSSSFSETGITIYSSEKTSSDLSRDVYTSVTFASKGTLAMTKWFENFTVMLSISILAISFGAMMLIAAIKNIPRILTGVFGTAVGSIAFIAKLLIATIVMILQIFGMVFLYYLSENILMSIILNLDGFTESMSAYLGTGVLIEFGKSFMIIVMTGLFTFFMIKNVNVFRELMEEVVSSGIDKLMTGLDTSTGGSGDLSTAGDKMAAKQGGGGAGGGQEATGIFGQSDDIASDQEHAARAQSETGELENEKLGAKAGRRAGIGAGLIGAKASDVAKGAVGIKGRSEDKFKKGEKAKVDAISRGQKHALSNFQGKGAEDSDKKNSKTTGKTSSKDTGAQRDENGDKILNENGKPMDEHGNEISNFAPVAFDNEKGGLAYGEDGEILASDGESYKDEEGNTMYADEDGNLVDEDGDQMMIGEDGVMAPNDGEPLSAAEAAGTLEGVRYDADGYEAMQEERELNKLAEDGGLDEEGRPTDEFGNGLSYEGVNGPEDASIDEEGFLTNDDGERLSKADLNSDVMAEEYNEVIDPDTGETHLQHKGDEVTPPSPIDSMDMDKAELGDVASAAKESSKDVAKAEARVAELEKNGGSEFAKAQAETRLDSAKESEDKVHEALGEKLEGSSDRMSPKHVKGAKQLEKSKGAKLASETKKLKAMKQGGSGASQAEIKDQASKVSSAQASATEATSLADGASSKLEAMKQEGSGATQEQIQEQESIVSNAQDSASKASANSKEASSKLTEMEKVGSGATNAQVQAQENKVDNAQRSASAVSTNASNVETAANTGRRLDQVANAGKMSERANKSLMSATAKRDNLVSSGASQEKIAQAETAVNRAIETKTSADNNEQAVSQAPKGSAQEIDQAVQKRNSTARVHGEAVKQHNRLKETGTSEQVAKADKQVKRLAKDKENAVKVHRDLNRPENFTPEKSVTTEVPNTTTRQAQQSLKESGVENYGDYKSAIAGHNKTIGQNTARKNQLDAEIKALESKGSSPQKVKAMKQQSNRMGKESKKLQKNKKDLVDNSHGLINQEKITTPLMSRPLNHNSGKVVNQLTEMNQNQSIYDKLEAKSKKGNVTDIEKSQMKHLGKSLKQSKSQLINQGIKPTVFKDSESMKRGAIQLNTALDGFKSGK